MSKFFRALTISGVLVLAPVVAQATVTATPSDPLNTAALQADQNAITLAQQALNNNPGSPQAQINYYSAELQYQVDELAFGVPGPVEGVGFPFVLMGLAAGGYAWRRQKQAPATGRDSSTSL